MKNKKKLILFFIVIWILIFTTDFIFVKLEKRPLFCFKFAEYNDGGSVQYMGLGYQVINFRKIVSDEKDSFSVNYYYIGPISSIDRPWRKVKGKAIEKYFKDNNLDYNFNYEKY